MVRVASLVCVCSLLAVAAPAWGQERVGRLTLDEAVTLAMRENAILKAKGFEVQSVRAGETTARVIPNPSASFTSEKYGASSGVTENTFTIGQPIELGGKRGRRVDSARAATRVTEQELADVRRQVVYQVKKAFTDALTARAALTLAEDNLKALDDVERLQRLRAEKGDISELELLRIQIQQYQFLRDAADARQALNSARTALRAVVGPERVAEGFELAGELGFRELSLQRNDLYRLAVDNRPDIRAAEAARAKARADVELARANAWWDVTPQLEYKRTDTNDHTFGFGLSVPLRVFDRNQGEIERTRAEVNRTDAVRQAVAVQALSEVDTAFGALASEQDKVLKLRDTYLPKAQRARETVEFAYRRGGVSLLDFLDAQRTYRETSLEYLRALGNYWTAVYQLEAAVGGPVEKN